MERVENVEVTTIFFEDIAEHSNKLQEAIRQADVMITTLNHADEARALLVDCSKPLLTIGAANISTLLDISKMDKGSKVAFVCLGKQGGQWMAESVKSAGIMQIESKAFGIDDKQAVLEAIQQSTCVYASSAVYDEVSALAADKSKLFPLVGEEQ
ncbi:hypothetical protein [Paenibacillus bouchesdurhonensis]|uniref:hypothetical protein n=1 Tax=Paenibacillus bouchesdurhonensis TaxID=1870990 RepID=UPI000DA5FB4C|nr:hypothetical protein [Paenibacillus bouchesdurhonensis]